MSATALLMREEALAPPTDGTDVQLKLSDKFY